LGAIVVVLVKIKRQKTCVRAEQELSNRLWGPKRLWCWCVDSAAATVRIAAASFAHVSSTIFQLRDLNGFIS
jgi:uncharacterized protein YmfQ (DUF2313 family)